MSTHCCFATLFPYPVAATDDGAQDDDGSAYGYYVDFDDASSFGGPRQEALPFRSSYRCLFSAFLRHKLV